MAINKDSYSLTWKKIMLLTLLFTLLLLLPIFLMTDRMMVLYQERIDADPTSDFSQWLQLAVGDVCFRTMRPEKAAEAYYKYLERYPEDERRDIILFNYARSLEDADRIEEARDTYEQFLAEYPEHEKTTEVNEGLRRLKFRSR